MNILLLLLLFSEPTPCHAYVEGAGANTERDCRLYEDLTVQHAVNAGERPGLSFHIVESLQCDGKAAIARAHSKIVGCSERSRHMTEIWLAEDKPENWLGLAMDGLDYANKLYMTRGEMAQKASEVLQEISNPDLKKKYHGVVDVRELK